ncbi:MAG: DMT family transporter [Janthinobacterium lividum]
MALTLKAPAPNVRSSDWRGVTACFGSILIWSGNTIVTKAAAGVIAPGSIAFYRWLLALSIMLPLVGPTAWRNRELALRHWKQLLTLGALGMVIYQSLAYKAAESTSAVSMGVILALMPLFSTLLASALAAERLTFLRITGAIVSLSGLVYLVSHGRPVSLIHNGVHIGDGLMLIAVISNSLYSVMLKRWTIPISIWEQIFWQILFSIVLLFPIWLAGPISPVTTINLPLVLYAGILSSLLSPMCWIVGVQRLGSARTALFTNLVPIVVALLAWLILGEHLQTFHLIGGTVALAGVWLGLREPLGIVGGKSTASR